ncbi:MAG: ATP phosphoribosyltransferase [Sneathiellales bacterium]|nr:ATP phosphoribosyltransferase [Sneathiellales bacterium]
MPSNEELVIALPKGRILKEVMPLVRAAGIEPEPAFDDPSSRLLHFKTNHPHISIIRVRSFDVATFVAFGAAHLGVAGNDVLLEHNYPEIYAPVDLDIGHCYLAVAQPKDMEDDKDPSRWSHVRIATKYPNLTHQYFSSQGIQAECIKLSGAMELAPGLGLCRRIVDLVSSGATLKANGLIEVEKILDITSRLVVNRAALKTRSVEMNDWIQKFREIVNER